MPVKIKQRDITDCGAACLASIASHYKLHIPVSKIRQIAGTDKKGTNALGMVKAAEKLGFEAKGVKGDKTALPKIPCPAVAHVIVKEVLHHYVVIYKATEKEVHVMDPGDGEMHKYTSAEFEKLWTGVLILLVPSEKFEAKNEKVSNLSRFWFLLKPHKSIILQALFGAIIYTVLGLSTSVYIQKITDNVLTDGNTNLLNLLSVGMITIIALQVIIGVFKSIFIFKTGQKIDAKLILGYYKHLLKLPQEFFDSMRVGEIVSRINDAVKIRAFINDTSISLIVNAFIIIFSFSLMFVYSWKLALIMMLVIPIYTVLYFITNKLNKKKERELMEDSAELESQLVESLNSIKTIKQFGIEDFTNLRTETRFIKLLRTVYSSGMNSLFSGTTSEVVNRVFTVILLWVGSLFVLDKTITPGELLSFYALLGYFMSPVVGLIGMNKTLQNAMIAADRMFEIMDLDYEEDDKNKMHFNKKHVGDICFKNVTFSYGTRTEVFQDFNLNIRKGQITAIIGESGSGKTTIAALIHKLYKINDGNIFIGDYNTANVSNESLRKEIGIVPQNLTLFAGTVIENIAVGDFYPDMEKIIQICKDLGISEFIEGMPNSYNTYIGENGTTLSGGQRQRLAIARALYRNPEILIFDEATSALDSESERYVQAAIKKLRNEGKTIIIIAHRLSTVIISDKIVVLSKGELMEEGSHQELMQKEELYYEMWMKQIPESYNTKVEILN